MAQQAYIGFDLGAESGRAMAGRLDGDRLTLEELHRFNHTPRRLPSGLHWDLIGLWGNILDGLGECVRWSKNQNVTLASVGIDTWGVDFGLLGGAGELLGLPHNHRDERHPPAHERMLEKLGREFVYERTGIQFMPINSLPQLLARHEAEPALLDKARRLLFMPDLLHYFLTGRESVEATIASTSQMIDPRTGEWATDVLEKLGLPSHMLGDIVPPGTDLGGLRQEVAEETGAPDSLRVIAPATHDTASAVAAVPADSSTEWAYLSSGTWSLMGAEIDEPCITDAARDVPLTNEGGVGGTIRFLRNIVGLWLVQECRRDYAQRGETYDYSRLTELASRAEPLTTLVDPQHGPFMHPGDMPGKIRQFAEQTGQPAPDEIGALIRCCLESLALYYRHTLENLESVLGKTFDVLHVVGGGGKNELLNQMTADAIGRPVVVGPYEATAIGNVLVQAMGTGDVKDLEHLRSIVRASVQPRTFEPRDRQTWDRAYDRFQGLLGG